jgi:ATP-binding cassette, subfamily B, bacterial MsbA
LVTRKAYKRLFDLVRPYWKRLALAILSMMGVGFATAGAAYLIKPVLDGIFVNKNETMLKILPLAVLVLVTVKGVCLWGNAYLSAYVGQQMITDLRRRLYDHIQTLPLTFFDSRATGDLMSRILNDVNFLQSSATAAVAGVMRDSFSIIGLVAVIFSRDWKLATIAVIILPMGFYPIVWLSRMLRKIAHKSQTSIAQLTISLHETIGGIRIVKAFGMENYEKKRFKAVNDKNFELCTKMVAVSSLSSPIMEFLGGMIIVFTIWYGGWCVIHGKTTPGNFFSFIAGLLMLYEPVKRLNSTITMLPLGLVAAERVFDIMEIPQETLDEDGSRILQPIKRSVEFRNVGFSYGENLVLKNININARAGEVIALVGMSGAGKTTLVNLLPRFYEVTEGAIFIDGVDIGEVTLSSLRAQIGIVTQQSILFNDTFRNNIAYGDITRPEEDIIAAAKAANAYDFIMRMPQGLDTSVGEMGARLSGGERQRICIARALLKNAPILILDEATSSLDSESENEVQNALETLMSGRTTFVIAHRLSTIRSADRILVLAGGAILEEGHHDELLRKGGEYRHLYELQFSQLQDGMPDVEDYVAAKAV